MTRTTIVDSWAFVEIATRGRRFSEVEGWFESGDRLVTVRDVVVETFGFIQKRKRSTRYAWMWLEGLRQSQVEILEPPFEAVFAYMEGADREGNLSLTDYAVAYMAHHENTTRVATGDREFRRLGLDPLFAA